MKKNAIQAIAAFLEKEVENVENVVKEIAAFIIKAEPEAKKILAEAIAAYKLAVAAVTPIESAIQALAILIADLSAL